MDEYRLAVAKNVAANARLFCVLVFVLNCLALFMTHYKLFAWGAVFAALAVGAGCLTDQTVSRFWRSFWSVAGHVLAVLALIVFIINIG